MQEERDEVSIASLDILDSTYESTTKYELKRRDEHASGTGLCMKDEGNWYEVDSGVVRADAKQ
jgi:hypothetical protein